jgi:high-affinity iron transporter
MTSELRMVGTNVKEKKLPFYTIATIIATSVIREGAEIILFIHGVLASSELKTLDLIPSAIIGGITGILFGLMIYLGLIKASSKYIFQITTILLVFLAAGMAAQIPNYLASAGILSAFSTPLWDSSWLIQEHTLIGKTLHAIIGYTEKPSGMQLGFYLVVFFTILFGSIKSGAGQVKKQPA